MAGLRPPVSDIGAPRPPTRASLALLALFGLLLLVLAFLDRLGVQSDAITEAVILAALGLFGLVALVAHGSRPADHYVAGRGVPPAIGGLAGAAGLAGLVAVGLAAGMFAGGAELLATALGLVVGALLLALIAPGLRRGGGYGVGDYLAVRFGRTARFAGTSAAFCASFLLLVAVLKTAGPLLTILIGMSEDHGLYVVTGLTALAGLTGGMRSLTWTQMVQYLLAFLACLLPVAYLTTGPGGIDIPGLAGLASFEGFRSPFAAGFSVRAAAGAVLPIILLGIGTASLPQMLARGFGAASARQASATMIWSALYVAALVAACLILGQALAGAIGADSEAALAGDVLTRAVSLISALPPLLVGLLMAGVLAALLAAGQAALFAAATALSLDLWDEILDRDGPAGRRILVARLILAGVAVAAAWAAAGGPADAPALLGWALAVAASGSFAALVLGLLWARCNEAGAVAGTVTGFGIAFVLFLFYLASLSEGTAVVVQGIGSTAAAALGVPASFLVAIVVSLVTKPAGQAAASAATRGDRRAKPAIRERPA